MADVSIVHPQHAQGMLTVGETVGHTGPRAVRAQSMSIGFSGFEGSSFAFLSACWSLASRTADLFCSAFIWSRKRSARLAASPWRDERASPSPKPDLCRGGASCATTASSLGSMVSRPLQQGHVMMNVAMATPYQKLEGEVLCTDGLVLPEGLDGSVVADVALLQDVDAVGEVEAEVHVLLGEQYGQTVALEPADLLLEMVDHEGSQAFGGLVEQEQVRIAHEGAGDGEHLLLASGEEAALAVDQLAQLGEEIEHAIERPRGAAVTAARRHVEVFPHGEIGKDAAVLRHEADAEI